MVRHYSSGSIPRCCGPYASFSGVRLTGAGRIPASCPAGFQGRYTVAPGDTMFFIAQRFGVTLAALIAANPHISDPNVIFPGDVLCVPGPPTSGRVPASCPAGFQGRYTVVSGDTMFTIAQRFGVTLDALIAANPHISDPNLIFPGDVLCVPGAAAPCRVPASCPAGFQGRYTVVSGDTMFSIAQRFGVTLDALIAANPHISNPNVIFPCDVLCVPGAAAPCRVPVSCPAGFQGRYTVVSGDTMFSIAQRFGVTLDALIAANPHITDPNVIFPCDVLCVPGPPAPCRVPVSCPSGFQGRYTVVSGDTMFSIAQRFGVTLDALIAANPHISDPNVIFPCDVLCVPGAAAACRVPVSCPAGFQGRYTVVSGDTMFSIAQRFGVTLDALIAANPHISNPNVIFPCDVLCVPGVPPPPPPGRVPASCPSGFQGRYTVVSGDTMFSIAQRFGVTLNALISANPHITDPNVLFPCDVLCVPCAQPGRVPTSCPSGFQGQYTVQAGDTMFLIAQRFGVTLDALIAANPHITDPNVISPCDVLCVPCPAPSAG